MSPMSESVYILKNMKSDIKKGWKERRRKLTMTIPNRREEVLLLLRKQVYADTLPEVQRSRMLSRVIPPLAEFLVILPSKRKHRRVSNHIDASPIALSCESVGASFEKATTGVDASKGFSHKGSFFSVSSRPGAVCQSSSEYTLHWLEHLEVCSSLIIIWWQKSAGKKPGDTQFLSNGRR